METAELFDDLQTGTKVKMIRIRQHDLRLHIQEIFGADTFDGSIGSDGHKEWRLDLAMGGRDRAQAGFSLGIGFMVLEKH